MELVSTLATGGDETRSLQDIEVLGDGLTTGVDSVLGHQTCAQLEQGLIVSLLQLIQDQPPGGVGEGSIHVHLHTEQ
jgi:hypothetical protein